MSWQPIETAPLDGTHVLVCAPGWREASEAYHEAEKRHEGWYLSGSHWTDATDCQCFPTLWQPMPIPPPPAFVKRHGLPPALAARVQGNAEALMRMLEGAKTEQRVQHFPDAAGIARGYGRG